MKLGNKAIVSVAAFCIYLILTLPLGFAQSASHFVQVNIKSSDGTQTLDTVNLASFESLVSKQIKPIEEQNNIFIKLDFTGRQHQITKGYVWLCQNSLIENCLKGNAPSYTFEKFLQEKRIWSDVGDLSGGSQKFPQTGNIFTLINLNVRGQDIWIGSFDIITRTGSRVSEFITKSVDLNSVDVLLKENGFANITKDFIANNFALPKKWIKETDSIVIGSVDNKQTKAIQHFGFESTQSPESFDPPGKVPGNLISPNTFKQYELLFAEGSLSNPITVFDNPTGTCGNNVCESQLGETPSNCCNDCGCSLTGYVCNKDPRDQNKAGVCTDTSTLQLVSRGVEKTSFKSCEVDNDVELALEIVNAPSGTRVNDFFYELDGKTKTDILCNQAQGTNKQLYECELTIEAVEDCRRGQRTLKNNAVFASVTLPDNSIKELNTSIPDFSVIQTAESFNEITEFTERRLTSIGDKLDRGVRKAEKLINQCVKFIENSIVFAYIMVGLAVVSGLAGLAKSGALGKTPQKWVGGPEGDFSDAKIVKTAEGSNQPGQINIYSGPTNLAGKAQTALFGMSKVFLESVGIVVDVGLSICEVGNTLLQVYVKISEALTTFTTFQVCVKTYQNMLARGSCSGGDPDNPQAAISASIQCISQLQQCSGHLNQMSSQLDGLSQHTQTARDKFNSRLPEGSKKVDFYLEEQGTGRVVNTCRERNVLIGLIPEGCEVPEDIKVTMEKKESTAAASDVQIDINSINSEISGIRSLLTHLKTAQADNTNSIETAIRTSASNIRDATSRIETTIEAPDASGLTEVLKYSTQISTEAVKIEALTSPLSTSDATIRSNLRIIETNVKKIENEIGLRREPSDITSSVYGPWASFTPASQIFNQGDGRYAFTFTCPGLNTKTLSVDYAADCSKIKRAESSGVAPIGPTSKLSLEIIGFENSGQVPLKKHSLNNQLKYVTNTRAIFVKVSNIDIENNAALLKQCTLSGKTGPLLMHTAFSPLTIDTGLTTPIFRITLEQNSPKENVKITYECTDKSDNSESVSEIVIFDESAQLDSPTNMDSLPKRIPKLKAINAIATRDKNDPTKISVTLSWGNHPSIVACEVDMGDGQKRQILTSGTTIKAVITNPNIEYDCYDYEDKTVSGGSGRITVPPAN